MSISDFFDWFYWNRKISQRFFNNFQLLKKKKEKLKKRWGKRADVLKFRLHIFLFYEGENIFCEGVFPTSPTFNRLIFSNPKNQAKKSEINIVNQAVKSFWFFEG